MDHHRAALQNGSQHIDADQVGVQHEASIPATVELHEANPRPVWIQTGATLQLRLVLRRQPVLAQLEQRTLLGAGQGSRLDVQPDQARPAAEFGRRVPVGIGLDLGKGGAGLLPGGGDHRRDVEPGQEVERLPIGGVPAQQVPELVPALLEGGIQRRRQRLGARDADGIACQAERDAKLRRMRHQLGDRRAWGDHRVHHSGCRRGAACQSSEPFERAGGAASLAAGPATEG